MFLQMLYNFQAAMSLCRKQQLQNTFAQSSSQNKAELVLFEEKELSRTTNPQETRFSRFMGNKDKKITKKADSILEKLRLTAPISFQHVSNFLNIISINERAVKDRAHQESYFRSIFYIKSVEKVQVRKNALIISLKTPNNFQSQSEKHKIQYLIQRYKSFGDQQFYQLALKLQTCFQKYQQTDFNAKLRSSYQSQPLSRFIESMHDKIYGCKVAPNKLVISRALLQLLGEDMQSFALGLCKFKTPLQEIISTEQYNPVINKSIDSISLLCDFLQGKLDLQTLQRESYLEFNDYLCARKQKKIYCRIKLYMPTPLMNCLEVIQVKEQSHRLAEPWPEEARTRKNLLLEETQEVRFRQIEALKHLATVHSNMLGENKHRTAGFAEISSLPVSNKL